MPAVTLPSSLNAGFSCESASRLVSGRMPWSVTTVSSEPFIFTFIGIDLALEAAFLGRLVRELVRAQAELVELGARDLPLVGDHLRRDALRDEVVARHQLVRPRRADLVDEVEGDAHRDVAHVLDAAADHDVVDAGADERGAEVDGLLGRAALAVDGRRRRLDREARPAARRCGRC